VQLFLRNQISVAIGLSLGERSRSLGENSRSYGPAGAALIGAMGVDFDGMIAGSWLGP
jgi:hypothetical protein